MAVPLDERAIEEHFVRSPGPGGQNVNKVSSAVELRFRVGESSLPEAVQTRLRALAGRRMQADGCLVVESHEHRTQTLNREAARERLADLIARASIVPKSRRATRPSKASREERIQVKRRQASVKAGRRRPGGEE